MWSGTLNIKKSKTTVALNPKLKQALDLSKLTDEQVISLGKKLLEIENTPKKHIQEVPSYTPKNHWKGSMFEASPSKQGSDMSSFSSM